MNRRFIRFVSIQVAVLAVLVILLVAFVRERGASNTYIVAPISATTTLSGVPADDLPLVNPAVTASLGKHFIIDFKPLQDQFAAIQKQYPQKTYVYFVYLNNDAWVGIGQDAMFTAASTIKVPLAMTLMKEAEGGKLSLSDSYTLTANDLNSGFGDLYKTGAGTSFTLGQLLQPMLEQSDNTAMDGIISALKLDGVTDPFGDVYDAMGWGASTLGTTSSYTLINLKTLSNMFIALYNATYDDPADSNLILHYLDDSIFNDQIPAGVPSAVSVAHKIGVNASNSTYSDCGIVYASERNFLLCAGSVGADQASANSFMAAISKASYSFVMNN